MELIRGHSAPSPTFYEEYLHLSLFPTLMSLHLMPITSTLLVPHEQHSWLPTSLYFDLCLLNLLINVFLKLNE